MYDPKLTQFERIKPKRKENLSDNKKKSWHYFLTSKAIF